jgi:glycogenin glucosyltransferase
MLRRNAKVFHFVPNTTPWNFYTVAHPEWELNFEPIIFFYWHQMHLQALQTIQKEEYSPYVQWPNVRRALDICSPQSTSYTPKKFVIQNKFSVLIGTWDRVSLLRKLILHYQKSRLIHKIYVTWHNPSLKPPEDFIKTVRKRPPVEILTQRYDSLNNRFNPIPNLETRSLLICDDDVRVNITDIEYAFDVWRGRPNSLVGVFPRYHSYNPQNNTFNYEIRSPDRPRVYSIMLTKFMFINSEFLYIYTCLLPPRIHRYIDDNMNCEDIAMNLLVSGMTGSRPAAVLLHVDDFGTTSGISIKAGHLTSRSQCMTDLIRLFGKDTLRYNREVFLPFRKKKA